MYPRESLPMPLCLSPHLVVPDLEVKSKDLSIATECLFILWKYAARLPTPSAGFVLWTHFHWQMVLRPHTPFSCMLHMVDLFFFNDICSKLTFSSIFQCPPALLVPSKARPSPDMFISFLFISIWRKTIFTCSPGCYIQSKVWVYSSISWCWSPGRKYCTDLYDPLASLWFFCIQCLLYPSDPGTIFTLNNCAVFSLTHAFSVGSSSLKI